MNTETIVQLTTGSLENPIRAQVPFSSPSCSFTPKDAQSCAKTAFGHTNCVTASAYGKTYRMTPSGTRLQR